MRLTRNFRLDEFINSRFYNEEQQLEVWKSFNENREILLPNIQKLANQLQTLRDYLNKTSIFDGEVKIKINIAYRPLWWELQKGRSGLSKHTFGMASDIKVFHFINNVRYEMDTKVVYNTIERLISKGEMLQGGLGLYNTFVHYDIRRKKARW